MQNLLKYLNRCWLLYLLGGLVVWFSVNQKVFQYAFLDYCRGTSLAMANCAGSSCEEKTLRDGVHYYYHLSKLFPNVSETDNVLGYCFYNLHDYSRSVNHFSRAVNSNPQNPGLYFNYGLALLKTGDYRKANEIFKKGEPIFTPVNFFHPNRVNSSKKDERVNPEEMMTEYVLALNQYKDLMMLTQQIIQTADPKLKKEVLEQIEDKIKHSKLYYYIPIYKMNYRGKQMDVI